MIKKISKPDDSDIDNMLASLNATDDVNANVDNETIVALVTDAEDFTPPIESKLEGDQDDPSDEFSFAICSNENCTLKAMCLRWRLRKQRAHMLPNIYYHDQDDCLVNLANHTGKFALDPIENWE
jgi:hypothetical protein